MPASQQSASSARQHWIASRRVLTVEGVGPAAVLIEDGAIADVVALKQLPEGAPVEDVGDLVVMPGLVDSHVHVNEPGRTEWEGFETATRSAAAGGISTLADMPLNCLPVTTTLEAFKTKLNAIDGRLWIDCAFYGGVVPGNAASLEPMIDAGIVAFKCFLVHSGIDDFPNVSESDLKQAMPILARRGVPLLVHAELQNGAESSGDPRQYATYLASRPRRWENNAIAMMIALCREHSCAVHIVHLSSSDALGSISDAKKSGLPFTVETCPHYLSLDAEHVPDGDTRFKCAPPIREKENRDRLWKGLHEGTIDFVVSDHSPCIPELKLLGEGDFMRAWGGISSLQFGLPVIWTEARARGHSLPELVAWMSTRTSKFLGLNGKKGMIAPGYDADLVVFDPEAELTVTSSIVHHRNKLTPYEGKTLHGIVRKTIVRGITVYEDGQFPAGPVGKPLLRNALGELR
jgi:allantoinase